MSDWNRALNVAIGVLEKRLEELPEVEVSYKTFAPHPAWDELDQVIDLLIDLKED